MNRGHKEGAKREIEVSKGFHQQGIPLLVHPRFLRKFNAGQIDLAKIIKTSQGFLGIICEVKSSHYPSPHQMKRLFISLELLGNYFDTPFKLTLCVSLPKLKSIY